MRSSVVTTWFYNSQRKIIRWINVISFTQSFIEYWSVIVLNQLLGKNSLYIAKAATSLIGIFGENKVNTMVADALAPHDTCAPTAICGPFY